MFIFLFPKRGYGLGNNFISKLFRVKLKLPEIRIKVYTEYTVIIEVGKNPDTADYWGSILKFLDKLKKSVKITPI